MRRTSPRLRFPLLAALFGAGALALVPAIAGAQCQTNSSCYPPNGCILASSPAMQYAGTPDVIRNVSLLSPTHCVAPPAPGLTADSFFDVFVELDLSTNNGGTFQSTSGSAHCTVHMLGTGGTPPTYQPRCSRWI
jgi:hypothetical protein